MRNCNVCQEDTCICAALEEMYKDVQWSDEEEMIPTTGIIPSGANIFYEN